MSGSRSSRKWSSSTTYSHTANEEIIVKKLTEGAFHLPGNNWWEDWVQTCANSHPLFAVCFQHPLHPLSKFMRGIGLVGSVMFGLALTNICWVGFIYNQTQQAPIFQVSAGGIIVNNGTSYVYMNNTVTYLTSDNVTPGMIVLWTIGSFLQAIYDNTIWYAVSCVCCCEACAWMREHKSFGKWFVIIFVLITCIISTVLVIVRAVLETQQQAVTVANIRSSSLVNETSTITQLQKTNKASWDFLMSFGLELFMAWFIFFPIVELILFTGILSCFGRLPFLGGRPAEMKEEAEEESARSTRRHEGGSHRSLA